MGRADSGGKGDRGRRERGRPHRSGGNGRKRSSGGRPTKSLASSLTRGYSLPNWVREDIIRVTARARRSDALERLSAAAEAFAQARYRQAHKHLLAAKELSPRGAPIRELLGLTAYRLEQWSEALRELRTFRRMTGDTAHLPVEMDVLRALDRPDDVERAWQQLNEYGGSPATLDEGRVVYGAFLLDRGDARGAWDVLKPKRITADAHESERRRWYVAARAAAVLGDVDTARQLLNGITSLDPAFPGLDELDREIRRAERS